jgi:hypothetical protein
MTGTEEMVSQKKRLFRVYFKSDGYQKNTG